LIETSPQGHPALGRIGRGGELHNKLPPQIRLTGQINLTIIVIKKERMMKTAAVSELKARLSEYLNQVKAGMEVLITDRGKPVARLVPVSRTKDLKETLVRMEKQGLIRLGPGKLPNDFWRIPRPEDPEGLVLKALLEEREAGR
jgi:prevent-host-death family protein